MPIARLGAGGTNSKRSNLHAPNTGASFAGLRPGLGRAGVTKMFSLVGRGGGLHKPIVVFQNQVGGIGRRPFRNWGAPRKLIPEAPAPQPTLGEEPDVPAPQPSPQPPLDEFPSEEYFHTPCPKLGRVECLLNSHCHWKDNKCEHVPHCSSYKTQLDCALHRQRHCHWNNGKCRHHVEDLNNDGVIDVEDQKISDHFWKIAEQIYIKLNKTSALEKIYHNLIDAYKKHQGNICYHSDLAGTAVLGTHSLESCACDECNISSRVHKDSNGNHIDFQGMKQDTCTEATSGPHTVYVHIYKPEVGDLNNDGVIDAEDQKISDHFKKIAEKIHYALNHTSTVNDIYQRLIDAYKKHQGNICYHSDLAGTAVLGTHSLEACACDGCNHHPRVHKDSYGNNIDFQGMKQDTCTEVTSGPHTVYVHIYKPEVGDLNNDGVIDAEDQKISAHFKKIAEKIHYALNHTSTVNDIYQRLIDAYKKHQGKLCYHSDLSGKAVLGTHSLESCACDGCNHHPRVHKDSNGNNIDFQGMKQDTCTEVTSGPYTVYLHKYKHEVEDLNKDGVTDEAESRFSGSLGDFVNRLLEENSEIKNFHTVTELYNILYKLYKTENKRACLIKTVYGHVHFASHALDGCECGNTCHLPSSVYTDLHTNNLIQYENEQFHPASCKQHHINQGDTHSMIISVHPFEHTDHFKALDANSDGKLTLGEVSQQVLDALDKDGDGAVSKKEHLVADLNNDGVVSSTEYNAHMNKSKLKERLITKVKEHLKTNTSCRSHFIQNMIIDNIIEHVHSMTSTQGSYNIHIDLNNQTAIPVTQSCDKCMYESTVHTNSLTNELHITPGMLHSETTSRISVCLTELSDDLSVHVILNEQAHTLVSFTDTWKDPTNPYHLLDVSTLVKNATAQSNHDPTAQYLLVGILQPLTTECPGSLATYIKNKLWKVQCDSAGCQSLQACMHDEGIDLHAGNSTEAELTCFIDVIGNNKLCHYSNVGNIAVALFKDATSTESY